MKYQPFPFDFYWIENKEEIDLLLLIFQSISKKYNRSIVVNYSPYYDDCCPLIKDDNIYIVQNNKKFSRNQFFEDDKFRRKLQSNIKNHVPKSVYNYIVYRAAESQKYQENQINIHSKLLSMSAYKILHFLCSTLYEDLYKQNQLFHKKCYSIDMTDRFGFYIEVNKNKTKLHLNNKDYKPKIVTK